MDAPSSSGVPAKNRHVVTWTPQEDDLLREQITLHRINSWTIISAHFKDKTSRQCRRRWCTYLNSEGKKGDWSAEEDLLLCEAQKILGNRWIEISKVVAGRTDNAVKNRFSTLCKKRAKDENNVPCVPIDSDRYLIIRERLISAGIDVSSLPAKKMRYDRSDSGERMRTTDMFLIPQVIEREQLRQPLVEVSQNAGCSTESSTNGTSTCTVSGAVVRGTSLQKDDPKLTTLLQQPEPLSSLGINVNTKASKESLDESLKKLEENKDGCGINDLADSFDSPIQKFSGFQSLANAISSPKFSKSERKLLLTVFGMSTGCSKDLSCERALF